MSSGTAVVVGFTWDGQPVGDDEAVTVTLNVDGDVLVIGVDAPFHDDPAPPAQPGALWQLWEWEVVEVFVAVGETYTEIELGPHGHHLVLQLDGIRKIVARELAIQFAAEVAGGRWTGTARVPVDLLPTGDARVNAYAIHGVGDARRYLAATPLPGDQPDFHQPHRFELSL